MTLPQTCILIAAVLVFMIIVIDGSAEPLQ
jgi:hypothetical protein